MKMTDLVLFGIEVVGVVKKRGCAFEHWMPFHESCL